jgi:hypothetical protein
MSREFSEEELRALEAEMEKLTVDDVLLQTLVTLINLGARKAGLAAPPDQEAPQRDLEQTRLAIDAARALVPLLEPRHGQELGPVRDALSRLQMAFVQLSGGAARAGAEEPARGAEQATARPSEEAGADKGPGPAQRSGRLWVPGQ